MLTKNIPDINPQYYRDNNSSSLILDTGPFSTKLQIYSFKNLAGSVNMFCYFKGQINLMVFYSLVILQSSENTFI